MEQRTVKTRRLSRATDAQLDSTEELLENFRAELVFAEFLCGTHPASATEWMKLIESASTIVSSAAQTVPLAEAIAQAEKVLSPLAEAAKTYTVHCVGHAHLDMNWMWSWPETVAATIDSFHTVLILMDEFPEFVFSQSQAAVYELVEQHDPELFARIQEKVAEGRWEVTASHWVECDKNMSGSDALARQLLYTRRYFSSRFELSAADVPIDWAPDTFGHAATVPTYLARGGVEYLYLHRPGAHGGERPLAFRWAGPDESEVLVVNDMNWGYNGVVRASDVVDKATRFAAAVGVRDAMFVFGVGDHGGGPTRRDLSAVAALDRLPVFPRVRFSSAKRYFELLAASRSELPQISGELNFEFTGCYTSQSIIKRANRLGEERIAEAEHACTISNLLTRANYPGAVLESAWRDVLFNQFHDILPGSGVRDTRTYAHGIFQRAIASAGSSATRAFRAVAALVETSHAEDAYASADAGYGAGVGYNSAEGRATMNDRSYATRGRPVVVFNPTSYERTEVIEFTVWDDGSHRPAGSDAHGGVFAGRRFEVHGPDGAVAEAQTVETDRYWGHEYARLVFPVTVGAFGYAAYGILESDAPDGSTGTARTENTSKTARHSNRPHHCSYSWSERETLALENGLVRLELDSDGGIARFLDVSSGAELIAPNEAGMNPLEFRYEQPHPMSAWHVDREMPDDSLRCTRITRGLDGPHVARIDATFHFSGSEFSITYELKVNDPGLYIGIKGTWFERGDETRGVPVLKLVLPFALERCSARFEIPFGSIDRESDILSDVPMLRWAALTGTSTAGPATVVVANDCKYGCLWDGRTVRIPLIRGSYHPDPLPEVGEHEMRFVVTPVVASADGADDIAAAYRVGRSFNAPLIPVGTDVHTGALPSGGALVQVEPGDVAVSGFKTSEDGTMVVLTVYDLTGIACTARLAFPRRIFGAVRAAVQLDLSEQPIGDVPVTADAEQSVIELPIGQNAVASVGIVFETSAVRMT
ncbi:MAG: alpha-mannosidase [Spirochaetaceae bacterium]|nr:MAG: alpha-mannosidase [Spirochaetaceae bacterium]